MQAKFWPIVGKVAAKFWSDAFIIGKKRPNCGQKAVNGDPIENGSEGLEILKELRFLVPEDEMCDQNINYLLTMLYFKCKLCPQRTHNEYKT